MRFLSLARPLRWAVRLLVLSGLILLPLGVPVAPGGTSSGISSAFAASDKIDPAVLRSAESSPDGKAYALVYFKEQADVSFAEEIADWEARGWAVYDTLKGVADRTQRDVVAEMADRKSAGAVAEYHSYWIVNLVTVRADAETLRWLAGRPEVAHVYAELKIEKPVVLPGVEEQRSPFAPEPGITRINADDVWTTYGITGTGAVIANVDTGVQYDHPALVRQYRGNLGGGNFDHNYNWIDPDGGSPVPIDNDGHGTHTMGTQVGEDASQTNQIGVAPGAKWIAGLGCCPTNDALLVAEQFMVAPTDLQGNLPDPSKRPHVVNNSWGGPGGSLIFNGVTAAQRAAGVFPTYSAGNNGAACATLGSPGDNPAVASSVAASDFNDNIAGFSSRGPNPFGGIGPDVSAPGVNVRSSVPGNAYGLSSGTSMASPHVGGAVGLILSAEPMMIGKTAQVAELLKKTALPRTSSQTCGGTPGSQIPNNTFGWGRIDVKLAVDMVWHAGTLAGQVASGGAGVAGATVSISRDIGGRVVTLTQTTGANGNYSFVAGAGSYNVWVDAFGYSPSGSASMTVNQGQTTTHNVALTALPLYTLSGAVLQETTLTPLYGKVEIVGQPRFSTATDPNTGAYSMLVPAGTYTFQASSAPGHAPMVEPVTISGNTDHHFHLTPRPDYTCADNVGVGGPTYEWIDATDGVRYQLGDEGTVPLNLPAPFNFYGAAQTAGRASANGVLYFGTAQQAGTNMVIPFIGLPNNAIYGLAEDLNPANGTQGYVYTKTLTVNNEQLFVVEWYQVEHWASGFPETFEIILNLTNHTVKAQYHTVSWPDFTTAGVESPLVSGSTYATVYSYANSAKLTDGRAVQYTPITGKPANHADYFACLPSQLSLPVILK
jgi:hypothetical protein